MITFSSFDLRVFLRVILVVLAWKLLSTDYRGLAYVTEGPALYHLKPVVVEQFVTWVHAVFFDTAWKAISIQCLAAGLLLLVCFRLRRGWLIAALITTFLIEWCVFQFRGSHGDFETALTILLLAAIWPVSWDKALGGDRQVSSAATSLGFVWALYIAVAYFMCGLSKPLAHLYWWQEVHMEWLYPSCVIGHGSMPSSLDTMAKLFSEFGQQYPWVGEFGAFSCIVFELGWPLALFNRWARVIIPPLMFLTHVAILLTGAILFISICVAGISIAIPWRNVSGWFSRLPQQPSVTTTAPLLPTRQWLLASCVVCFIVFVPAILNTSAYYPFYNYNGFGWTHQLIAKPHKVYRLAYRDPQTQDFVILSFNHGGFYGFKTGYVTLDLHGYIEQQDASLKQQCLERIGSYVRALRHYDSNRFLLGHLTCPEHVITVGQPIPPEKFAELHIVRGIYDWRRRGLQVEWGDLGPLPTRVTPELQPESCQ